MPPTAITLAKLTEYSVAKISDQRRAGLRCQAEGAKELLCYLGRIMDNHFDETEIEERIARCSDRRNPRC